MAERDTDQIVLLDEELRGTAYRPIAALGRGGMGSVYEVEHRALKRRMVVKILREQDRPDLEDRLRLEAQTLAQLSHPNVVQVIDFARTASGRPFLVTERLYGRTLKALVGDSGKLPIDAAARYATEALSGLSAVHRAGVVHRDVKLENLFLCDADEHGAARVKVLDFGIAKLIVGGGEAPIDVAPLESATAQGLMVGTPSFMSPEQILGLPVDQRADLYAVGVVLYRLVAGRNPFICRDLIEYAAAHAGEKPAPPSRFADLPEGFDALVLKALEKDPAARYATAAEMVVALERYLLPPPAPPRRRAQVKTEALPLPAPPRARPCSRAAGHPAAEASCGARPGRRDGPARDARARGAAAGAAVPSGRWRREARARSGHGRPRAPARADRASGDRLAHRRSRRDRRAVGGAHRPLTRLGAQGGRITAAFRYLACAERRDVPRSQEDGAHGERRRRRAATSLDGANGREPGHDAGSAARLRHDRSGAGAGGGPPRDRRDRAPAEARGLQAQRQGGRG
jgi:serine/threonine protein kinase